MTLHEAVARNMRSHWDYAPEPEVVTRCPECRKARRRTVERLNITLTLEKDHVIIRIRDYGRGIPAGELPYVKNRFYKGSSKNRGSGIGLAVCDEIISRHGGKLDIANAEGGGCIAEISLPLSEN